MDEIVESLPAGTRILDLACGRGSFLAGKALTVRTDRERPPDHLSGEYVEADASRLPFRAGSFHAVICNHGLEHFDNLADALSEIARVVRRDGCLYVAVPDASTVTDRLYRWLFQGGGHVNAFRSAPELARTVSESTGLPCVATLTLYSSLLFLQRFRFHRRPPRPLWLIGNGNSRCIALLTWFLRVFDNVFSTRTSVYGWALYFGRVPSAVEVREWRNVCVRCGHGSSEARLIAESDVRRSLLFWRSYRCLQCGEWNLLTPDRLK
jgi:SAM-dependent methyltransferase